MVSQDTELPYCQYCGKVIQGRSDKKYCDVQCKNRHHNQKNRNLSGLQYEVAKKHKKNKKVLENILSNGIDCTCVQQVVLKTAGFDFQVFTETTIIESTGILIFWNYDLGIELNHDETIQLWVRGENNEFFKL